MRAWWRGLGTVVMAGIVSVACATTRVASDAARRCSESPEKAILTFLHGIAELNPELLRAVVPEDLSPFAVFGEGDVEVGRTVVNRLLDHPEVRRGNEVDSRYRLVEAEDLENGAEKKIHVERQVFVVREGMRMVEQVYRRPFLVRFDPRGNCIVAMKPLGHEWTPVH